MAWDNPSGLQQLISVGRDIVKQLSALYTVLGNSYISLAGNNTFTGTNDFDGVVGILGGLKLKTRVVTAAGAVTVTAADVVVVVNKTVGAATVVDLPAGVLNTYFVIKDGKGDAGANNITITPAAGNIDGAGTLVISTNYGVARLVYNGTQWNAI